MAFPYMQFAPPMNDKEILCPHIISLNQKHPHHTFTSPVRQRKH